MARLRFRRGRWSGRWRAGRAAEGGAWELERPGWAFCQGLVADEAGDGDAGVEEVVAGGHDFGLGVGACFKLRQFAVDKPGAGLGW